MLASLIAVRDGVPRSRAATGHPQNKHSAPEHKHMDGGETLGMLQALTEASPAACTRALMLADGDVERACDLIFDGIIPRNFAGDGGSLAGSGNADIAPGNAEIPAGSSDEGNDAMSDCDGGEPAEGAALNGGPASMGAGGGLSVTGRPLFQFGAGASPPKAGASPPKAGAKPAFKFSTGGSLSAAGLPAAAGGGSPAPWLGVSPAFGASSRGRGRAAGASGRPAFNFSPPHPTTGGGARPTGAGGGFGFGGPRAIVPDGAATAANPFGGAANPFGAANRGGGAARPFGRAPQSGLEQAVENLQAMGFDGQKVRTPPSPAQPPTHTCQTELAPEVGRQRQARNVLLEIRPHGPIGDHEIQVCPTSCPDFVSRPAALAAPAALSSPSPHQHSARSTNPPCVGA